MGLAVALLVASPVAATPAPIPDNSCQGTVTTKTVSGQVVDVFLTCSGGCDTGEGGCELQEANTISFCQCSKSTQPSACVTVKTAKGARCVNVSCNEACDRYEVCWTAPDPTIEFCDSWCECP